MRMSMNGESERKKEKSVVCFNVILQNTLAGIGKAGSELI
jgi:hypothetical protein